MSRKQAAPTGSVILVILAILAILAILIMPQRHD